jgi:hypothetical protein
MNSTNNLLAKLLDLGATLRPPLSIKEVTNAEKALDSRFPDGIRKFYRYSNGLKKNTEELAWDFYSLEQMIERTLESRKLESFTLYEGEVLHFSDFVLFCDVLYDAVTYHFCGNPESRNFGSFYGVQGVFEGGAEGSTGWLVAHTYEEFVQVFLQQSGEQILANE